MSSNRLRILHVSEPNTSGVATLLRHFIAEQVRQGHDVHLLAPPGSQSWPNAGYVPWRFERHRARTFLSGVRELRAVVRRVEPDVIHLHSFLAGLLGRLPMRLSGTADVPVVYQPHAWATDLFTRPAVKWAVAASERGSAGRTAG